MVNQLPLFSRPYKPPIQHFDGETYHHKDLPRLTLQMGRVFDLMQDGYWRTPQEIEAATGANWASANARLRDLRKEKFGSHTVNRRRKGEAGKGTYEYQLIVNND